MDRSITWAFDIELPFNYGNDIFRLLKELGYLGHRELLVLIWTQTGLTQVMTLLARHVMCPQRMNFIQLNRAMVLVFFFFTIFFILQLRNLEWLNLWTRRTIINQFRRFLLTWLMEGWTGALSAPVMLMQWFLLLNAFMMYISIPQMLHMYFRIWQLTFVKCICYAGLGCCCARRCASQRCSFQDPPPECSEWKDPQRNLLWELQTTYRPSSGSGKIHEQG